MKNLFVCLLSMVCLASAYAQSADKPNYLSIQFVYLEVQQEGRNVVLNWNSSMYNPTDFFTLERSPDGVTFVPFKGTMLVGDTRQKNMTYTETDFKPYAKSYYRIKQTDSDGNYVYSNVKKIELIEKDFASVFPNPTNQHEIQVAVHLEEQTDVDVVITNWQGKEVYSIILPSTAAEEPLGIDIRDFDTGHYIVHVNTGNGRYAYTEKISIIK